MVWAAGSCSYSMAKATPVWLWATSWHEAWVLGGALVSVSVWCSGSNSIISHGELGGEGERDR